MEIAVNFPPGTATLLDELDSVLFIHSNTVLDGIKIVFPASEKLKTLYALLNLDYEKLMVLLRDGRTLIGYLRSVDQFANLVLHRTIERIHVGKQFGDIPRGVFIVRGENVVLLGEIDREKEFSLPLTEVSVEEILDAQRREHETKQEQEKLLAKALKERGLSYVPDLNHDDMF